MDATVYKKSRIQGAATHALVIGVGSYGHLPGGGGTPAAESWGLRQLSSPPHSARAIARWLIEEFVHPTKPLASVALLVAEKTPTPFDFKVKGNEKSVAVAGAELQEVKQAIEAWHARGDEEADNLLLFFFCGHGLALGPDLALLLNDFAENHLSPLDGALDFRRFRAAMNECAAREQCYFIDACRSDSELLSHNSGFAGNPIIQATGAYSDTDRIRQAPVFHSTLSGASSYATKNEPSHYTAALIEALRGAAAGDETGPWQVRTALLHDALGAMLRDLSSRLSIPQMQINATDDLSTIDLNVIKDPWVPLVVTCDPELANDKAAFSCLGPAFNDKRRPRKGSWRLKVPIDSYDIAANFKDGAFNSALRKAFPARPTFRRVTLKVRP